ncbi:MAG: hypothetical protein EZS28_054743, partial [Streblomastix strix]
MLPDDPKLKGSRVNALFKSAERQWDQRQLFQLGCSFNQLIFEQRYWVALAGSISNCKERHSEQRRDRNYEFAVRNPIAGKGKSQNQKISQVGTIINLETKNETNVKLKRELVPRTKPRN